VHNMKSN